METLILVLASQVEKAKVEADEESVPRKTHNNVSCEKYFENSFYKFIELCFISKEVSINS